MKKIMLVFAVAAICACSKTPTEKAVENGNPVELTFRVPVSATKASGAVDESSIGSLQVFVFGPDGQIQSSGVADGNSLQLTCTTGEKTIAALVISPVESDVRNLEDLYLLQSGYDANAAGHFVMSGQIGKILTSSEDVDIPVSRLVSKVSLVSVHNDFELPQHQELEFSLRSISMVHVPASMTYFDGSLSGDWIDRGESGLLYDAFTPVAVPYGESVEVGNCLYCYPNTSAADQIATCLLLEASLGNHVYYYRATMPQMQPNKCYNVSMTITRPGSTTPDDAFGKEDATFFVTVMEWSGNVDVNETI